MEHEQGHFDIAKLFALKLEQRFRDYQVASRANTDLQAIYKNIVADRLATDNLFDAKIRGAKNDGPQKAFIDSIRKQIPHCIKND